MSICTILHTGKLTLFINEQISMNVLMPLLTTVTQMLHVPTLLGTSSVVATMDTEEMALFVMVLTFYMYVYVHTWYNRVSEVNLMMWIVNLA